MAAVVDRTTVESWDALTGENVVRYQTGSEIVASSVVANRIAWSPDSSTLAVASISSISLFNARTAQLIRSFSPLQTLSEGTPPLLPSSNPALSLLLLRSGGGFIAIDDIAWSPNGKEMSVYMSNGVAIWNPQSGSLVTHLNVYLINSASSARELWQPHGHLLATLGCQDAACQATQVSLWDTTTWRVVKQYPNVYMFDWSPDGKQLALVNTAKPRVQIVDALTGQQVRQVTPQIYATWVVHWSPDGSRLFLETVNSAASTITDIGLWSVTSGKQLYAFPYHDCFGARWSPDSRYLSCLREESGSTGDVAQILVLVA